MILGGAEHALYEHVAKSLRHDHEKIEPTSEPWLVEAERSWIIAAFGIRAIACSAQGARFCPRASRTEIDVL
jgi:hypothetical protein